jgi:predicted peroxiredoxin
MDKLFIIVTHAEDNPELATMPMLMAVTATASEMYPVVLLQSMAVHMATKGYAEKVHEAFFPPMDELLQAFLEGKGRLLVCEPCMKKRGIAKEDLIEGAIVANAPTIIKEIADAKNVISY